MKKSHLFRRVTGLILLVLLIYFAGIFIYGWASDWQPGATPVSIALDQVSTTKVLADSVFTLVTWNVGYGGLGAESDFFYDDQGMWYSGNSMIRSPRNLIEKNLNGALALLQQHKDSVDFFLLQEVDIESDRSHRIRQYDAYQKALPGFMVDFAVNYPSRYWSLGMLMDRCCRGWPPSAGLNPLKPPATNSRAITQCLTGYSSSTAAPHCTATLPCVAKIW